MFKKLVAVCLMGYMVFAAAHLFAGDVSNGEQLAKGCKCHKDQLNGWPAEKLAHELHAFKDGTRIQKFMNKKAATLSDSDIDDLAAWFASQK